MEIGIGLDASLGLSFPELRAVAREAASLGYGSVWTPSGAPDRDGFQLCAQWATASADLASGCLPSGIAVIPAPLWTVPALVQQAATVSAISGGRFILGLGTGGIYSAEFRRSFGLPAQPVVALMRDYLVTLRGLLAGETVDHDGTAVTLHGLKMAARPIPVPLYLAALGPRLLRLAGELADGVALNWCTPEQRSWCRARIAEGARRAGRDPAAVRMMEYIRICVDDDEAVARKALAQAVLGYALARPGASSAQGYRGHFARMGFDAVLTALEARRDAGAGMDELVEACPTELLHSVGYFGRPEGAAAAFRRLAAGLDTAVVRIVAAHPGIEATRATLRACQPG